MSKRIAERGLKRTCQACGTRFYDLNRDPITCPVCQAVFQIAAPAQRPETGTGAVADKVAKKPVKKPEIVPDELGPAVELPADDAVVADAEATGEEAAIEGDAETFLEQEEEDTDVSGFIEGGIEEGGEEEA